MVKKEMIELFEGAVEEDMSVELNPNDIKNLLFWLKSSKCGNAEIELKCDYTQIKAADKEAQKLIGHLDDIKKSIDSISLRQQQIKKA